MFAPQKLKIYQPYSNKYLQILAYPINIFPFVFFFFFFFLYIYKCVVFIFFIFIYFVYFSCIIIVLVTEGCNPYSVNINTLHTHLSKPPIPHNPHPAKKIPRILIEQKKSVLKPANDHTKKKGRELLVILGRFGSEANVRYFHAQKLFEVRLD